MGREYNRKGSWHVVATWRKSSPQVCLACKSSPQVCLASTRSAAAPRRLSPPTTAHAAVAARLSSFLSPRPPPLLTRVQVSAPTSTLGVDRACAMPPQSSQMNEPNGTAATGSPSSHSNRVDSPDATGELQLGPRSDASRARLSLLSRESGSELSPLSPLHEHATRAHGHTNHGLAHSPSPRGSHVGGHVPPPSARATQRSTRALRGPGLRTRR